MSEWQPIDTAPRDGRKIFIYKNGWDEAPVASWSANDAEDGIFYGWKIDSFMFCAGVEDGFLGWNEDIEDGNMPTHWMPLPTQPR